MRRRLIHLPIVMALVSAACMAPTPAITPEAYEAAERALRYPLTEVEMDDFTEDCLREQGVTVFQRRPNGQGFIGFNVTARDEEALSDCRQQLWDTYGYPKGPETAAEFRVLYDRYLTQAECLRSLGLTVDVPSFDSYYDDRGEWTPYQDLPEPVDGAQWRLWNETCPQSPWEYEPLAGPRR